MKVADIPTEVFNRIVKDMHLQGWRRIEEHDNFDAWIDDGKVVLNKSGDALTFKWDNWMEGSVGGPDSVARAMRAKYDLK